jgi:ADP-ribosylglycohydrolase
VGGWFADDLDQVVKEARASAMVTHMHPEGVAGAIAVAVAAGMSYQLRGKTGEDAALEFWNEVHKRTPEGETRLGIAEAFKIRTSDSVEAAARSLGNGSGITCPDTVPFTLWCAAKHLGNYRSAIAATASGGGDVDTNCAIVGGIVALSSGWEAIPANWLQQMEPLPFPPRR